MLRNIREILFFLLLTVVFATALKSCVVDAYKIPSGSMEPVLAEGDYLLVNKFLYGARTPHTFLFIPLPEFRFPALMQVHRGHVIVFRYPGDPDESIPVRTSALVKRCVGLPGDTIAIVNGSVTVNGIRTDFFPAAAKDLKPIFVPKKGMTVAVNARNFLQWRTFILREGSTAELIDGVVHIDGVPTLFYTVKRDYYFVLGDNINNSADSRAWGFVPEEFILGKAMLIYWSRNTEGMRWDRIGSIIK